MQKSLELQAEKLWNTVTRTSWVSGGNLEEMQPVGTWLMWLEKGTKTSGI